MLKRREIKTSEEDTFIRMWSTSRDSESGESVEFIEFQGDKFEEDERNDISELDGAHTISMIKGHIMTINRPNEDIITLTLYRVKGSSFTKLEEFEAKCEINTLHIFNLLMSKGNIWEQMALVNYSYVNSYHRSSNFKFTIYKTKKDWILHVSTRTDDLTINLTESEACKDNFDPKTGSIMCHTMIYDDIGLSYLSIITFYWIQSNGEIKNSQVELPYGKYYLNASDRTYWKAGDNYYTQFYFDVMPLLDLCIDRVKGLKLETKSLPLELKERINKD